MGSLAFGALILTLVQIARMILEYIDHKTRREAEFIVCVTARVLSAWFIFISLTFVLLSLNLDNGTKCTLFNATFSL